MSLRSFRWFLFGLTLGGWLFYRWVRSMIMTSAGYIKDSDAIFVIHDLMNDSLVPLIVLVPLTLLTILVFCVSEAVFAHKAKR